MALEVYLDHDYIVDKYLSVYQVVGGSFSKWIIPVILKYRLSREKIFLGRVGFGLMKVFEEYSPRVAGIPAKKAFFEGIKALQPYITPLEVHAHYSPSNTVRRLLRKAGDSLERAALDLILKLEDIGVRLGDIGITGSIMLQVHDPYISDIDIVLYDCEHLSTIREAGTIEPFRGEMLRKWIEAQSHRLGLIPEIVRKLYNPCRRGLFRGKTVSVIPVGKEPMWTKVPDLFNARYLGDVEAILRLENEECSYTYYPHIMYGVREATIRGRGLTDNIILVNYETVFSFIPQDIDRVRARGIGYTKNDYTVIVTGVRESKGYIFPVSF